MTYLLLAEKPSAAKNFATALGGMSGTYDGKPYKITALFGHMLEFGEPHEMVDHKDDQERFKSWSSEYIPWDLSKLSWEKRPRSSRNPRTGAVTTMAGHIRAIKKEAQGCSAIVIATDKDPTGEGQMIGWEVIQAIGWTGPVKRLYFIDESEKELQKGFKNMVDLPKASQDGEYLKAMVRERWDYASMQLVRVATDVVRKQGYGVKVVRQGRLKSVMTKLVADQLALVKAYVKKPYYEVKFKDDKGNTYSRKFEDGDDFRFDTKDQATKDLANYHASDVVVDSKTRKQTPPGKLLDLGGLASILGTKGYKSKEILATYQKMYEAKIVSYPRTEDKFISVEQFNEMLPLVDNIARVVGADVSLLTHRTPRKSHVKNGGAHGANRPGLVVPSSLDALSKYGPSAKAIYELLAKNFLAMFGEDYVYDQYKAHIKDYPEFKTTVSVPVDLGFKAIFDADKETADEDDDKEKEGTGIGSTGEPVVAEGVNKKPPHPTHKWLERQLSKYDVGTGATRVSTLSEITTGKNAILTDTRGRLNLTKLGEITAALLDGSQIGSPVVTEKLYKAMRAVGEGTQKPEPVIDTVTSLIKHDKEVFFKNAQRLKAVVGAPSGELQGFVQKEKAAGVHAPTSQQVSFNRVWGGHRFTDEEVAKLLAGEDVTITATTKSGKKMTVVGTLEEGTYKGKTFWGFQRKPADAFTADTAVFPTTWSGYTFTPEDEARLRRGEKIKIKAISKKGKPYDVMVSFGKDTYKGVTSWKIIPDFDSLGAMDKDPTEYTLKDAPFKAEFSGYKLTQKEIEAVRNGEEIMVTATSQKTGKPFNCNLSLKLREYNGRKFWGLEARFK